MDDEVGVRVVDGVANLPEQREPRAQVEALLAAIRRDRRALDELHHEVGFAARRHAAVDERHDIRMSQRRENLALGAEAARRVLVDTGAAITLMATAWVNPPSTRSAR